MIVLVDNSPLTDDENFKILQIVVVVVAGKNIFNQQNCMKIYKTYEQQ
jgi:hypothetical protein